MCECADEIASLVVCRRAVVAGLRDGSLVVLAPRSLRALRVVAGLHTSRVNALALADDNLYSASTSLVLTRALPLIQCGTVLSLPMGDMHSGACAASCLPHACPPAHFGMFVLSMSGGVFALLRRCQALHGAPESAPRLLLQAGACCLHCRAAGIVRLYVCQCAEQPGAVGGDGVDS